MGRKLSVEVHPAAELFPWMDDASFEALKQDIKQHGQRDYVTFYQGKLLDGRNRWAACHELGIDCNSAEFDEESEIDPYDYVISINLHRRHLTTSQRSVVAGKMAKLKHGEVGRGRELDPQNCESIEKAAKLLNVSPRSVSSAKQVIDKGASSVVEAVERGEITVALASKLVNEVPDKKEQASVVKKGAKAIREYITPQNDYVEDEPEPEPKKSKPKKSRFVELWEAETERLVALKAIVDSLQPHEKEVVKTWLA